MRSREMIAAAVEDVANVLSRLKRLLASIALHGFRSDPLYAYVVKRVRGAEEILRENRILEAVRSGNGVRYVFASTEAYRRGLRFFEALGQRPLLLAIDRMPPERAYRFVEVTPWAAKCTCPDAVHAAAKADNVFTRLTGIGQPSLYRYTLCKHTLAALAHALASGALSLHSQPLRNTLWLMLFTSYLRIHGVRADPRIVREAVERLQQGRRLGLPQPN